MKEIFSQMIMRLFCVEPWYIGNFDDTHEGFEFNPDPRVMMQIKFSMGNKMNDQDRHIRIENHKMRFYPNTLESKTIYSGPCILLEDGQVDYSFYEKIIKNWRAF